MFDDVLAGVLRTWCAAYCTSPCYLIGGPDDHRLQRNFSAGIVILCTVLACPSAEDTQVKVIALLFANKALLEVNGKQKVVAVPEKPLPTVLPCSLPSGRAGGIVVVDGQAVELGTQPATSQETFKKRESSRLKVVPNTHGMYYVNGTINGQATSFLVDTGATYVTMSGQQSATDR